MQCLRQTKNKIQNMKSLSQHLNEHFEIAIILEENKNKHLKAINITTSKLFHTSNPQSRNKILKEGLKTSGKTENWLSNTNINGKVIFAIMSNNNNDAYYSTYDDDIYEIDVNKIKNHQWFLDPNFQSNSTKHIITFEDIPVTAIKLIHKGTGDALE